MTIEKGKQMLVNHMTRITHRRLNKQLEKVKLDLEKAQLAVGEAAGQSHDWHDNFPFEQAQRDVEFYASRARTLQERLSSAKFIEPNQDTEKVHVGNTVIVHFSDAEEPEQFTILGPNDSDNKQGWISYTTPIAQAMLGRKAGETVVAQTPAGNLNIKIVSILPGEFE